MANYKRVKGVLSLFIDEKRVVFTTLEDETEYEELDDFLYTESKNKVVCAFMKEQELKATKKYLIETIRDGWRIEPFLIPYGKKEIGFKLFRDTRNTYDKVFYDLKYKVGTDKFTMEHNLELIQDIHPVAGYTSKLRKELKTDEKLVKDTIEYAPSMASIIYSRPLQEFKNVKCYDACSFYPYLLTQPLPHYKDYIDNEGEDKFEKGYTYFGAIEITKIKAKKNYFPLTLVGENGTKTIQEQGENIVNRGQRLISADKVVLNGFLPDLLALLKQNYDYESYRLSKKVLRFELKIDYTLRAKVLEVFESKQAKKRNGLNYDAEKVVFNRIYGFFITKGTDNPAHYGQYIVSQGRLIINSLAHSIGFKDFVQAHTDSVKFIGNHEDVIERYNSSIEFDELGKFVLEHVFDKCVYYSHITAKYEENGKLGFKHGGIAEYGMKPLYGLTYEQVNTKTPFFLTLDYLYTKKGGYEAYGINTSFRHSSRLEKIVERMNDV